MAEFTEGAHQSEFIMSEAEGTRSREIVTIAVSQTLAVGQLLGQVAVGALSAAASAVAAGAAATTGNGVISAVTADPGAKLGVWNVVFIEPVTNLGAFEVFDPDGELAVPPTGAVGTAYNGTVGINFSVADGSTDFASGNAFTVTVTAADATAQDQYKTLNPTATDGTQHVRAVLTEAVTTDADNTRDIVVLARDAEVNGNLLAYPAAATDDDKLAYNASLAALGIIVR